MDYGATQDEEEAFGPSQQDLFCAVDGSGSADADGALRIVFLHRKQQLFDLEMPAEEKARGAAA